MGPHSMKRPPKYVQASWIGTGSHASTSGVEASSPLRYPVCLGRPNL